MVILIVEDNGHMRRMLTELVSCAFEGTVLEAPDGASALALFREARPQIVLMDVALPDANGIDVATKIKSLIPETHVIMVSNHDGRVYRERAGAVGIVAYISKDEVHEQLPSVLSALGDRLL